MDWDVVTERGASLSASQMRTGMLPRPKKQGKTSLLLSDNSAFPFFFSLPVSVIYLELPPDFIPNFISAPVQSRE